MAFDNSVSTEHRVYLVVQFAADTACHLFACSKTGWGGEGGVAEIPAASPNMSTDICSMTGG